MNKPIVHYFGGCDIRVGKNAIITTVDHPLLSNSGGLSRTTEVLSYDKVTGDFETKNTIYKLKESK